MLCVYNCIYMYIYMYVIVNKYIYMYIIHIYIYHILSKWLVIWFCFGCPHEIPLKHAITGSHGVLPLLCITGFPSTHLGPKFAWNHPQMGVVYGIVFPTCSTSNPKQHWKSESMAIIHVHEISLRSLHIRISLGKN